MLSNQAIGLIALRAKRARLHHRQIARHAINTDVQETADEQAEQRGQQGFDQARVLSTTVVISLVLIIVPSRAHVLGFGVLQEIVQRRHVRDGEAFHAVQKSAAQNVRFEERPGRIQRQLRPAHRRLLFHQLLGRERGVTVHGLQMLRQRAAREVQNIGFQMADVALHHTDSWT